MCVRACGWMRVIACKRLMSNESSSLQIEGRAGRDREGARA